MDLDPSNADDKLGFGVIRESLLEYVTNPQGRERVLKNRPASDLGHVRKEMGFVAEVQSALSSDDAIPLRGFDDVLPALRSATPLNSYLGGPDLVLISQVLETIRLLTSFWHMRAERYPLVAARSATVTELRAVEQAIDRVVDARGEVRDDASAELRRIRRETVRAQAQLRDTLHRELKAAIGRGFATEEQPTVRGGRMVIPIRSEAKRKIAGFVHDTSSSGQTVYLEPAACLDLNNEVRELESAERQEILRLLRETTAQVRNHLLEIHDGVDFLGWFDFVHARARLAIAIDASVPELNDRCEISLKDARNPALVLLFRRMGSGAHEDDGRQVIPLNVHVGDRMRTIIITGPNAGGKTVAMKTVGLLSLMVAHGIPVSAHPNSSIGLFERLFVDIGDEQSIEEDLSTFSSHVANLSRMLAAADERTLVLIDEAGTGTDPQEGAALARAVLEQLTAAGARTIATTHHGALKAFAHEASLVQNGSMTFDEQTLQPTYHFRSGIPGSSYAFPIARRQGLAQPVLDRASELLGTQQTSFEALIEDFQARSNEMEQTIANLETARLEAEADRLRFAARLEALQTGREEVRKRALREAEAVLAEANARVERTIRDIREAQADRESTRRARQELEEYRQSIHHARERAERRGRRRGRSIQRESPRTRTSEIRPGDHVVVDEGSMAGEVMEIQGQMATLTVGATRLRAEVSRLRKVSGSSAGARHHRRTRRDVQSTQVAQMPAIDARTSLDVRGQRAAEAVQAVTRFIDDAVAANLDLVEVRHGTGTGALRTAIREALDRFSTVSNYEDAPWDRGGPGVTLISLR